MTKGASCLCLVLEYFLRIPFTDQFNHYWCPIFNILDLRAITGGDSFLLTQLTASAIGENATVCSVDAW